MSQRVVSLRRLRKECLYDKEINGVHHYGVICAQCGAGIAFPSLNGHLPTKDIRFALSGYAVLWWSNFRKDKPWRKQWALCPLCSIELGLVKGFGVTGDEEI